MDYIMNEAFSDMNMKIGVIACLNKKGYYTEEAAKLKRRKSYSRQFKEAYYGELIDEVYDYYKNLHIENDKLDMIEVFNTNVTADCYDLMVKEWDGEDGRFNINNLDGIEQLHNLVEFDGEMLALQGADISSLLKCPKLKKVNLESTELTEDAKKVVSQLREKGVEVIV